MTKRQLKKTSKRKSLSTKYKIKKHVREHNKRIKKEARKAKKLNLPVKSKNKITRLPNLYPNKQQEMEEEDLQREFDKLENKQGYKGVTSQDLNDMIDESGVSDNNIIKKESEDENINHNNKNKSDFKRELNILINKSDFILEVIDARDPLAYRSKELENNVNNFKDKGLIVILNKIDLVSKNNLDSWSKYIKRDIPTVPFSTKDNTVFQNSLQELLEIIKSMSNHKKLTNKQLYVGIVGYPNTGKSTLIKAILNKYNNKSRKSTLIQEYNEIQFDNHKLFDTPGVILSKVEIGSVMPKNTKLVNDLKTPIEIIKTLIERVEHDYLLELYEIADFDNYTEFLVNISKKYNYFIKKGYNDLERAARKVLQDIIEGVIKYETPFE